MGKEKASQMILYILTPGTYEYCVGKKYLAGVIKLMILRWRHNNNSISRSTKNTGTDILRRRRESFDTDRKGNGNSTTEVETERYSQEQRNGA